MQRRLCSCVDPYLKFIRFSEFPAGFGESDAASIVIPFVKIVGKVLMDAGSTNSFCRIHLYVCRIRERAVSDFRIRTAPAHRSCCPKIPRTRHNESSAARRENMPACSAHCTAADRRLVRWDRDEPFQSPPAVSAMKRPPAMRLPAGVAKYSRHASLPERKFGAELYNLPCSGFRSIYWLKVCCPAFHSACSCASECWVLLMKLAFGLELVGRPPQGRELSAARRPSDTTRSVPCERQQDKPAICTVDRFLLEHQRGTSTGSNRHRGVVLCSSGVSGHGWNCEAGMAGRDFIVARSPVPEWTRAVGPLHVPDGRSGRRRHCGRLAAIE